MVSLIIGHKGSGKTKLLVDRVNAAVEKSNGNVICVEKETKLTNKKNKQTKQNTTNKKTKTKFDSLYGVLSGLCAGDHDITDVFVDATFRIGGRDYEAFADFLKKVDELSKITDTAFTFTVSTDLENLHERIFEYCEKVN